jgi:hypothetical protein
MMQKEQLLKTFRIFAPSKELYYESKRKRKESEGVLGVL